MYNATYIFEGRSVGTQSDDDLCFFPKKHTNTEVNGRTYFVKSFTLLGQTIIYILEKKRPQIK
jgi:hypothetical protein